MDQELFDKVLARLNKEAEPKRTIGGTAKDVGISAAKGILGIPEMALGALKLSQIGSEGAEQAIGGSDNPLVQAAGRAAGSALNPLGGLWRLDKATGGHANRALNYASGKVAGWQEALEDKYSDAQKAANKRVEDAQGFWGTTGAMLQNPSTIAHMAIESLPTMWGGAKAGQFAVKGGLKALEKAGAKGASGMFKTLGEEAGKNAGKRVLSTEGAQRAAKWGGRLGEGLATTAGMAEQISQENGGAPLTAGQGLASFGAGALTSGLSAFGGAVGKKFGAADIDELLAGGLGMMGKDGQRLAAREAARELAGNLTAKELQAGIRAEGKDFVEKHIARQLAESGEKLTAKQIAKGIAAGTFSEGVLEELPQSMQEQVWQNIATGKAWDEDVMKSGAQGMLTGGLMGAGANIWASTPGSQRKSREAHAAEAAHEAAMERKAQLQEYAKWRLSPEGKETRAKMARAQAGRHASAIERAELQAARQAEMAARQAAQEEAWRKTHKTSGPMETQLWQAPEDMPQEVREQYRQAEEKYQERRAAAGPELPSWHPQSRQNRERARGTEQYREEQRQAAMAAENARREQEWIDDQERLKLAVLMTVRNEHREKVSSIIDRLKQIADQKQAGQATPEVDEESQRLKTLILMTLAGQNKSGNDEGVAAAQQLMVSQETPPAPVESELDAPTRAALLMGLGQEAERQVRQTTPSARDEQSSMFNRTEKDMPPSYFDAVAKDDERKAKAKAEEDAQRKAEADASNLSAIERMYNQLFYEGTGQGLPVTRENSPIAAGQVTDEMIEAEARGDERAAAKAEADAAAAKEQAAAQERAATQQRLEDAFIQPATTPRQQAVALEDEDIAAYERKQERQAREAERLKALSETIWEPHETPPELAERLAVLEAQMNAGERGQKFFTGGQGEETVVTGMKSTNPEWMRQPKTEQEKADPDRQLLYKTGKADIRTVLNKWREGKPLTENQREVWYALQRAAWRYGDDAPYLDQGYEDYRYAEKHGMTLEQPYAVAAGALQDGDTVLVRDREGGIDAATVSDDPNTRTITIKDGVVRRYGYGEPVQIEGHKPVEQPGATPDADAARGAALETQAQSGPIGKALSAGNILPGDQQAPGMGIGPLMQATGQEAPAPVVGAQAAPAAEEDAPDIFEEQKTYREQVREKRAQRKLAESKARRQKVAAAQEREARRQGGLGLLAFMKDGRKSAPQTTEETTKQETSPEAAAIRKEGDERVAEVTKKIQTLHQKQLRIQNKLDKATTPEEKSAQEEALRQVRIEIRQARASIQPIEDETQARIDALKSGREKPQQAEAPAKREEPKKGTGGKQSSIADFIKDHFIIAGMPSAPAAKPKPEPKAEQQAPPRKQEPQQAPAENATGEPLNDKAKEDIEQYFKAGDIGKPNVRLVHVDDMINGNTVENARTVETAQHYLDMAEQGRKLDPWPVRLNPDGSSADPTFFIHLKGRGARYALVEVRDDGQEQQAPKKQAAKPAPAKVEQAEAMQKPASGDNPLLAEKQRQIEEIERKIPELGARAEQARKLSATAKTDKTKKSYETRAKNLAKELVKARRELAELKDEAEVIVEREKNPFTPEQEQFADTLRKTSHATDAEGNEFEINGKAIIDVGGSVQGYGVTMRNPKTGYYDGDIGGIGSVFRSKERAIQAAVERANFEAGTKPAEQAARPEPAPTAEQQAQTPAQEAAPAATGEATAEAGQSTVPQSADMHDDGSPARRPDESLDDFKARVKAWKEGGSKSKAQQEAESLSNADIVALVAKVRDRITNEESGKQDAAKDAKPEQAAKPKPGRITEEELDHLFGGKPKKGKTPGKKATTKTAAKPKKAGTKTASKAAAEGIAAAAKAMDETLNGIVKMFAGKGMMGSGLVFDEDTYREAKPHFIKAWEYAQQAKKSLEEFIEILFRKFGGVQAEAYVVKFIQDISEGKLETEENDNGGEAATETKPQAAGKADDAGNVRPVGEPVAGHRPGALEAVPSQVVGGDGGGKPDSNGGRGGGKNPRRDSGTDESRVPVSRGGRNGEGAVHTGEAGAGRADGDGVTGRDPNQTSSPAAIPALNFRITDALELGKGGETQKYNDNVAAIRLLKKIQKENRRATPEEQAVLARYVGWGGLPNAFRNQRDKSVKSGWEKRVAELEELLTPEELKAARDTTTDAHYTSQDVVNAIWRGLKRLGFTGGNVLEPSVGSGNFLGLMPQELAGKTRFIGSELDGITAQIAKLLYPNELIYHTGFEKLPMLDNSMDAMVGNPPFGEQSIVFARQPWLNRHSIHNQFVLSSLASLRPGGVMGFVVSRYLMDNQDDAVRKLIAGQAKLLGAIRLPGTAFKENARTEVVTDIIFLQKNTEHEQMLWDTTEESKREFPDWVKTRNFDDGKPDLPVKHVNTYFLDNPNHIVGVMNREGSMRQANDVGVTFTGDMAAALNSKIDAILPQNVIKDFSVERSEKVREEMVQHLEHVFAGKSLGDISLRLVPGETDENGAPKRELVQVYGRESITGSGTVMTSRVLTKDTPWAASLIQTPDARWYEIVDKLDDKGKPVKVKREDGTDTKRNVKETLWYDSEDDIPASKRLGKKYDLLVAATEIIDLVRNQNSLEINDAPEKEIERNRALLNAAYEKFVQNYGYANNPRTRKLVGETPNGPWLLALEATYREKKKGVPESATKADILLKRVNYPVGKQSRAENMGDALSVSLSEMGRVDIDRMAELRDVGSDQVIKELCDDPEKPLIFYDPETHRWEKADEYLSGNVRRKLNAAIAAREEAAMTGATEQEQRRWERAIAALEAVQPEPWESSKITPTAGATWIPEDVYADFYNHLTGGSASVKFTALSNTFDIREGSKGGKEAAWQTADKTVAELFSYMLNSRTVKITRTDGDKKYVDTEASQECNDKIKEMREEFHEWVFSDTGRRERLTQVFNDKYNVRVLKQYDGSHLQLPGKVPDSIIKMRRHQLNAIWRGIVDRFVLYDHAVGAGKTFTGIARAMERRRMGLSRKPMIVVPNHLVRQFAKDVYTLYPAAKVLAATPDDMSAVNRRRLFGRIATGDWDIVIVPHSSFNFIGIDPILEASYIQEEIDIVTEALAEAEAEDEANGLFRPSQTVKDLTRLEKKLRARMEKLKARSDASKDKLLTFEQLGIDDLTIDEAHEFKNLFYTSNMQAHGMGNRAGSDRAYGVYTKVKSLRDSGGSTAFMTGTPISNSAVEMYTMMRYLAGDTLKEMGLEHFDAWRTQFVDASSAWEPTESGKGIKMVERLGREWSNMRSLMDMYYSFADCVSNEDIQQWYLEDNGKEFPLPRVKDGGRQMIEVKPTPTQLLVMQDIMDGFDTLPNIKDYKERNKERLRLMDRARKVSLDARAVDPELPGDEGGKLGMVTSKIYSFYRQYDKQKGTQLVFLDRSVPHSKGDEKIVAEYDDWVRKLTAAEEAAAEAEDGAAQEAAEKAAQEAADHLEKFNPHEIEELRNALKGGWNAYQQIKDNLVALGIPAEEIRFVQEANTDKQKQDLFDDVKSGKVRVLIGSSQRMGAGTNVQDRLVALHHVDVTWKPSDIEQREGRIIRQGNMFATEGSELYDPNFEVTILAYGTERTIDAKMWNLNSTKLKMINGIRKYNGDFTMEFDDEESVSMAEMAAILSGDPLQTERVQLDSEIEKLSRNHKAFLRSKYQAEDRLAYTKRVLRDFPAQSEVLSKYAEISKKGRAEERKWRRSLTITIDGETYTNEQRDEAWRYLSDKVNATNESQGAVPLAVDIDGTTYRNQDKIRAAFDRALGDDSPFVAEFEGKRWASQILLRRRIAEIVNEKAKGQDDEIDDVRIGMIKMGGLDFELSFSTLIETSARNGEPFKAIHFHFDQQTEKDNKAEREHRLVATADGAFMNSNQEGYGDLSLNSIQFMFRNVQEAIRLLPQRAEKQRDILENARKSLPTLEQEAVKEWPKQEEYDQKKARLAEVEAKLKAQADAAQHGSAAGAGIDIDGTVAPEAKLSVAAVPVGDRADIEAELASAIGRGRAKRVLHARNGHIRTVETQEEARRMVGANNETVKRSENGTIQGFYLNGVAYLVKDGIARGNVMGVLMHEYGEHAAQLGFADNVGYRAILASIKNRQNENSETGKAIQAAMARVPKGTKPEHYWNEVVAYLVEANANIKTTALDRITHFFKKWLHKITGLGADNFTHKDLVMFARSAVKAAGRTSAKATTDRATSDMLASFAKQAGVSLEQLQAEYEATAKKYEKELKEGRKAPNGKKSKLNKRQWILVRTPRFKAWFGNWELKHKDFAIVELEDAPFNNTDAAIAWAKENGILGVMTNEETGGKGEISISISSIREMLNPGQREQSVSNAVHHAALMQIKNIIRESEIVDSHPDYKKDSNRKRTPLAGINPGVSIDVLYGAVKTDSGIYRVKTTVKRYADANADDKAYAYHVEDIKVLAGTLGNDANATTPSASTSISGNSLLQGVHKVNQNDGTDGALALDDFSKVLDENGEPLVVWHGSKQKFWVFDPEKRGKNTGTELSKKWFFAGDKATASSYHHPANLREIFSGPGFNYTGERLERELQAVMERGSLHPLFMNMKTPLVVDTAGYDWAAHREKGDALMEYSEQAEKGGHDGIIFLNVPDNGDAKGESKSTVYAFKDSTQVKSATENTGAFDPNDPDIRYSIAAPSNDNGPLFSIASPSAPAATPPNPANNNAVTGQSFIDRILANAAPKWRDRWERFIYNFLDSNDPRERVWKRAGAPSDKDFVTIERLRGKKAAAEQKRFKREMLDPLLDTLGKAGLSVSDLEEYAHALHTPERNQRMREVNAKRTLDELIKNMPERDAQDIKDQIDFIRTQGKQNGWTESDIQRAYLDLMQDVFRNIPAREQAQRAAERALAANASPSQAAIQRVEKGARQLEETKKIRDKWQEESIRFAGMTDAEAATIVQKWRGDSKYAALQKAQRQLAAINAATLDVLHEAGELGDEEYQAMKNGYSFYVPLHRDGFQDTRPPAVGRSTGPVGSPFKVAKGSMRQVVNILANSVQAHETAINRRHKLEAGRALYEFAQAHPDAGITVERQEKKPTHDKEGNIVMYTSQAEPEDGVFVKVDGVKYLLRFNTDTSTPEGRTLARFLDSVKGADAQLGGMVKMLHQATSWLAAVNTSFSPEFVVTNFSRDFQTAFIHLNQDEIEMDGLKRAVAKDVFPAMRGIFAAERGNRSSSMAKWYADYEANGGKVGWMQSYEQIGDLAKEIQNELKLHQDGHHAYKAWRGMRDLVENANAAIENCMRLATYKALVERGVSRQKAARVASALTVDFTQHGKMSPQINALYMFFNASVQGTVRMVQAMATSRKVQAIAGGIAGAGFVLQMLALAGGGDDDSGEPNIFGIPESTRERNIIIMLPGGDGKKYIKIPKAYGYGALYDFGAELANSIYMSANGRKYDHAAGAMRVVSSFANSFNPIQSATLLQALSPTLLDPVVYVAENKSWAGTPLMPEQSPYGPSKPDSERAWKGTSPIFKKLSKTLNDMTGGDAYQGGWADISPETFSMAWDTATGGLGRFVGNVVALPFTAASGETEARRVPFLRQVYGEWNDRAITSRYYEAMDRAEIAHMRFKNAESLAERKRLYQEPDHKLYLQSRLAERQIKALRKRQQLMEAAGDKDGAERMRQRIVEEQAKVLKMAA